MKKSSKHLLIGSLVAAVLMIAASYYFRNHQYFEEINSAFFVLACTQLLRYSSKIQNQRKKSNSF